MVTSRRHPGGAAHRGPYCWSLRLAAAPPRLARRVRCSAHRFVRSRALPGGCGGRARDRPPGRAGTRRPVRRGRARLYLVGGTVRDALLGRPEHRPRLHHRRPARRRARARRRLGERRVGHRHRVRHGRRCGAAASPWRSRRSAPTPTTACRRNPVVAYGDTHRGRPACAATSPSTRWRCRAHRRAARVRRPVRRARRAGARACCDTPGHAGGVVRRRPAADAARRPVRRAARVHARAARRRGDDGDGGRAGAGSPPSGCRSSCRSCCSARTRGAGIELLVDTGLAEVVLPEVPAHAAGDRRAHPAQGRLRALAGRCWSRRSTSRPTARTSCCAWPRCCTTSASPAPARSSRTAG